MANENDKQIKNLLDTIENKRIKLGTKPKPQWKTNGIIHGENINTINSLDKCIVLTSALLLKKSYDQKACEFLDVAKQDSEQISWVNDALDDLKLRTQIIAWESEKKKLQAMEKKLKDLRSDDAKTHDALTDIASALK